MRSIFCHVQNSFSPVSSISKHLANVFEAGELKEEATISKMETVQQEGSRAVKRSVMMHKNNEIWLDEDRMWHRKES